MRDAGHATDAAINDHRIKAVGMVSAVNIGSMFRNSWDNIAKSADAISALESDPTARSTDASGATFVTMPLAPLRKEGATNKELEEAWEYYHTLLCYECSTAPGFATLRSLNQIITYHALNMAEVFLTQPLLTVAGSKWMSDTLYRRAHRTGKHYGAKLMASMMCHGMSTKLCRCWLPFFKSNL